MTPAHREGEGMPHLKISILGPAPGGGTTIGCLTNPAHDRFIDRAIERGGQVLRVWETDGRSSSRTVWSMWGAR